MKRKIYEKIGNAFIKGEAKEVKKLKLLPLENIELGTRILTENNIKTYKQTQTGTAWHHRSAAGTVASTKEGELLHAVWRELGHSGEEGSVSDYEKKEKGLDNVRKLLENAEDATAHWRKTQDKLNEQTIKIVTTVVNLLISIGGAAFGQVYTSAIAKAISGQVTTLLKAIVKKSLELYFKREGEAEIQKGVKDSAISLLSGMVEVAYSSVTLIPIETGMKDALKEAAPAKELELLTKAAFGIYKKEVTGIVSTSLKETVELYFKKGPGFMTALQDNFLKQPERTIKALQDLMYDVGKQEYIRIADAATAGKEEETPAEESAAKTTESAATESASETAPALSADKINTLVKTTMYKELVDKKMKDKSKVGMQQLLDALLGTSKAAPKKKDFAATKPEEFNKGSIAEAKPIDSTEEEKLKELSKDLSVDEVSKTAVKVLRSVIAELGIYIGIAEDKPEAIVGEFTKALTEAGLPKDKMLKKGTEVYEKFNEALIYMMKYLPEEHRGEMLKVKGQLETTKSLFIDELFAAAKSTK